MMRAFALALLFLTGCSSSSPPSPLIVARPYDIDVPASYTAGKSYPLIVLLHGYSATGFVQDAYFGFNNLADARGVLIAHPDGTPDSTGARFWNATDACCDFANTGVDDVAYLNAVVDDVEKNYNIDKKRVFFVGHSNGGFMSHRMACDASARIAGIVALAGDNWKDESKCNPTTPVAVLQVHGDNDNMVPYNGQGPMPSAHDSVMSWAHKNKCTGDLADTGMTLDLDTQLAGAETSVASFNCSSGAAELWTMHGGGHLPNLRLPDWGNDLFDWLMQHPKP